MSVQSTIHILYVPGLGSKFDIWRRRFLEHWTLYGVTTELVPMNWQNAESYDEKFERLSLAIDRGRGKRIVLVGESAGGSMVLNMYAARPQDLDKVITLCGKNSHPENVSPQIYQKNPSFKKSMEEVGAAAASLTREQRQKFVSIHPIYDPTVFVSDTLIPNCKSVRLWAVGHSVPIIFALTIFAWKVVSEARR